MRRIAVAVHENDGRRADAGIEGRLQGRAGGRRIEGRQRLSLCRHALVNLDHRFVEQLRQHNVAFEQPRAVLIGDPQRILETARHHQQCAIALALQQRVGGHRGAHLDRGDALRGNGLFTA